MEAPLVAEPVCLLFISIVKSRSQSPGVHFKPSLHVHSFLQQSTSCGHRCQSPLRVSGSPPGSVSPLCFPAGVPDAQQVSGCPSARNVETSGCTEEWTVYIWWSTAVFLPRTLILTRLKSTWSFLAGWDGGSTGWY